MGVGRIGKEGGGGGGGVGGNITKGSYIIEEEGVCIARFIPVKKLRTLTYTNLSAL